jgi:hypothetical protein
MSSGLHHGVIGALLEKTTASMVAVDVQGRCYASGKLLDLLEHGDNLRFAGIGVVPGLPLTGENWLVSEIPGWYPVVKSSLRRAFCFSAELKLAGQGQMFLFDFNLAAYLGAASVFRRDLLAVEVLPCLSARWHRVKERLGC